MSMKQILPIVTLPDIRLRELSTPLTAEHILESSMQKFADAMIDTMYDDDGIGLAAPQVGRNIRLIVVGKDALAEQTALPFDTKSDAIFFNPEITEYSWKSGIEEEGCLSVPGLAGFVERHIKISVTATLRDGTKVKFAANDYFARVLQHEIDHLNGILFIDRAKETWKHDRKHPKAV
ncbi:MAG: peptide deformylase [Candidatus Magasanikbacteria bacterium]|nr:peptide deformylase [Candidatus Magasanikbacteria bacterium]